MTEQEIFDTVLKQLREQGRASIRQTLGVQGNYSCAYRGEKGRRCAVGWLIPDIAYFPELEGHGVKALSRMFPEFWKTLGFTDPQFRLMIELQLAHDCFLPYFDRELRVGNVLASWERQMQKIAESFKLTYSPQIQPERTS